MTGPHPAVLVTLAELAGRDVSPDGARWTPPTHRPDGSPYLPETVALLKAATSATTWDDYEATK